MNIRILIAAGVSALVLGLTATSATAAPDTVRRASPPSSNPHDVFRKVIKVPLAPEAAARGRMTGTCDCPKVTPRR